MDTLFTKEQLNKIKERFKQEDKTTILVISGSEDRLIKAKGELEEVLGDIVDDNWHSINTPVFIRWMQVDKVDLVSEYEHDILINLDG